MNEEENIIEMTLAGTNGIFPESIKLVEDPNIFFVDTGASVSSTGTVDGLINMITTRFGE